MADYLFYGFFSAAKAGKTGLTVTCTVYRAATGAVVANAQAASEVGGGLYRYSHSDATPGDYLAVFITADATVDAQHVAALASVIIPRIDAAMTTRLASADYSAAPSAGSVADAVWDEVTSAHAAAGTTGKALADAGNAGDPWAAPVRTLTSSAVQTAATVEGDSITVMRGDTWTVAITGLGDLTGYVSLDFTAKSSTRQPDSEAMVRIRKNVSGAGDGLLVLAGAAGTAAQGSIAINDAGAGNITITLAAAASALVSPDGAYHYDIQMISAAGVSTLTAGTLAVVADVGRAVT